jgi:hypothetical protein
MGWKVQVVNEGRQGRYFNNSGDSYNRTMISNELRQLPRHSPFRPFRLHLADGRRIDVPHPDFILVLHKEPMAIFEHDDGRTEWIHLPIVTRFEALPGSHAA